MPMRPLVATLYACGLLALTAAVGACGDSSPANATPADAWGFDASMAKHTADASKDVATPHDARVSTEDGGDGLAAAARAACTFKRGALADTTFGPSTRLGSKNPIEHIIVLMQENRSFDSYFGHLAKYRKTLGLTETIDSAPEDASNPDYPAGAQGAAAGGDASVHYYHHADKLCFFDTSHLYTGIQTEYDHGQNDGFYFASAGQGDAHDVTTGIDPALLDGSRALSWYDERDLPYYYSLYSTFAIADHYFADVLAPTYPNRSYLYAATSFGETGNYFPDLSAFPYPSNPGLITDELEQAGVSWYLYSESSPSLGIVLGSKVLTRYGRNPKRTLKEFYDDVKAGTLPTVAFLDADFTESSPSGDDEHPPADVEIGQHFVWKIVKAVTEGPKWSQTALFITYDEGGGIYDHVNPPPACKPDDIAPVYNAPDTDATPANFGVYGFRVPLVVISPYAKRGYVSHATYSHSSVTRFIEAKAGLAALTARDANSDAFTDMFDWDDPPFLSPPTFTEPNIDQAALAACKSALTPTKSP